MWAIYIVVIIWIIVHFHSLYKVVKDDDAISTLVSIAFIAVGIVALIQLINHG